MKYGGLKMGVGVFTIFGIVLVILKVMHQLDWSWWLVLSPFVIDGIFAIVVFVFGIKLFGSHMRDKKNLDKDWYGEW